jgi:hypothetical protein
VTRNYIILALLIALMASPALGVDVMKGGLRSGIVTIQPGLIQKSLAPDLVVVEVVPGIPVYGDSSSEASLPLKVTVKNQGAATSESFKISVDVTSAEGRYVRPFTVPGQADIWYPRQDGLGAGESATFEGTLYLGLPGGPSLAGQTLILDVMVDSCSGDEFQPEYCRVQESYETNNNMQSTVRMPLARAGIITPPPSEIIQIVDVPSGIKKIETPQLEGITGGLRPMLPMQLPFYFADGMDPVGSVYRVESLIAPGTPIYTRTSGQIYSFTFHPAIPQKLYFVNANDVSIFRAVEISSGTWGAEEVVLSRDTYVRDLAFRFNEAGELRLYFSEATGAGGNGMIYEVMGDGSAVPFYEVDLSTVGGFWAGDFAFDDAGNLYLSSGNRIPAMIYKVTMSGGSPTGAPVEIYRNDREPIAGMVVKDNSIYYANWGDKVYRLSLATGSRSVYTDSSRGWISDVGFRNVAWTTTPPLPSGFPTITSVSEGLF